MKTRYIALLALGLSLFGQSLFSAEAARKYYPSGFTPPVEQDTSSAKTEATATTAQPTSNQAPATKQIIIKTVSIRKTAPAASRDPLLVLIDTHRYYDALRMVDARLKKTPANISLLLLRGKILREGGNYDQAVAQFQGILDKSRSKNVKASALNGLGWTHYQQALHNKNVGDTPSTKASLTFAENAFKQSTQQLASFPFPWAGLSRVYMADNRPHEAAQVIKQALRLAPNNLTVQLANAELLLAQNKAEDALQSLYGLKKSTTNEPEVFLLLARASLDVGKTDDAIINLKQLLELVPDHTEALKLLSYSYEVKMKPEDASIVLEKAIALNLADTQSVESLLKIYDQRNEGERGILLLKTLLKNKPENLVYAHALLTRLNDTGRWDEAYQEVLPLMDTVVSNTTSADTLKRPVVFLFAQAIYQKGRGLLDRRTLFSDPTVQNLRQFAETQLRNTLHTEKATTSTALQDRLTLLYLDPMAEMPALPSPLKPHEADLPLALQVTFLAGALNVHDNLLEFAKKAPTRLEIARQLYNVGDYDGAKVIANHVLIDEPNSFEAKDLKENIAESQKDAHEQLTSLSILPRKISDNYWQKAASEALRVGSGDWKTHAMLAKVLEKRHFPSLALFHQRMAAHYAPTAKEKEYWERKADKTARSLSSPLSSSQ